MVPAPKIDVGCLACIRLQAKHRAPHFYGVSKTLSKAEIGTIMVAKDAARGAIGMPRCNAVP